MAQEIVEKPVSTHQDLYQLALLVVEGLVLLFISLAFWYNIGTDVALRENWFWLLWFAVPIFFLRFHLSGYFWTHTYLHDLLIIFILLSAFNYMNAPLQRESYLAVMGRPLAGIWTVIYFIEVTRVTKNLKTALVLMIAMGFILTFFALTATQWDTAKMGVLAPIVDYLPEFDYRVLAEKLDRRFCSPFIGMIHEGNCFNPGLLLEYSRLSFNVNEMSGALAWMIPLMAGLVLFAPPRDADNKDMTQTRFWQVIRIIGAGLFVTMLMTLILGQSRFALSGVFVSMVFLVFVIIPNQRWRRVLLAGFAVAALPLVAIVFSVVISTVNGDNAQGGLSERDTGSLEYRMQVWQGSIEMMTDNPSTGVGMYMFRTAMLNSPYRTSDIPDPHAHNEWLNIGAEMGLAGLLLFIGIQGMVGWMLWQGWQQGNRDSRTIILATAAGLLAHAIYGLGDTIALQDRFHFIFWWLVGLAVAQYVLLHDRRESPAIGASPVDTGDKK